MAQRVVQDDASKPRSFSLWSVLRVALSLALLGFLFHKLGPSDIGRTLVQADALYVALALGLYLVGVLVRARRWQVLVSAHDVHVPLGALTALYFVGAFFSNVLPGSITGDVVKMYQLSRYSRRSDVAVSTVLMDRVTGFLVLFAIAAVAVLFAHQLVPWQTSALILVVAVGAWVGLWLLMRRGWWQRLRDRIGLLDRLARIERVSKLYHTVAVYNRGVTLHALGLSLLLHIILILVRYLIALALGVHLPIWYFLLFIPIISLVTSVPITLSGLGVREGAYVYLFSQVGVEGPSAISMSLTFNGLRLIGGALGGILYALGARRYMPQGKE